MAAGMGKGHGHSKGGREVASFWNSALIDKQSGMSLHP